jgi:mRNA interferase RelE/StbE
LWSIGSITGHTSTAHVKARTRPSIHPPRVGLLQQELAGFRSARRGAYRIVYEILEEERVVVVQRIDHRAHVYRPRYGSDASLDFNQPVEPKEDEMGRKLMPVG